MDISKLRVSLTESDLNELVRRYLPSDQPVEDVKVELSSEGIEISGQYPFFITVRFQTLWEVSIQNGLVAARLSRFKAMGVPGNIFKSAILKIIEDAAIQEPWIRIDGDQILADLELGCAKHAIPARLRLKAITISQQQLVIEAGEE